VLFAPNMEGGLVPSTRRVGRCHGRRLGRREGGGGGGGGQAFSVADHIRDAVEGPPPTFHIGDAVEGTKRGRRAA